MPSENRKFGNLGEKAACVFLKKNGFSILETNYQKRSGEIDIIAKNRNIIHFIEVKTRTEQSIEKYGLPQEAISRHKKKRLVQTALFYLAENNYPEDTNWQIDAFSIIISENRKKAKINFIQNAVSFDNL